MIGTNPNTSYPLARCQGDCDSDDHCLPGLICTQNYTFNGETPGCIISEGDTNNYCVDPNDFPYVVLYPTGDDRYRMNLDNGNPDDYESWLETTPLQVSLISGSNRIRLQVPAGYDSGMFIDNMKIEGLRTPTLPSSFRNAPHFMSLIMEYNQYGEQTLRDAQYETEEVLDDIFYHPNVAPFLCIRLIQRLVTSNASPSHVKSCVNAFRSGNFTSGGQHFGDGSYGNLEAAIAAIVLDKEATDHTLKHDPSHGSLREPILKFMSLLRSMEYVNQIPVESLLGPPLQDKYHLNL